LRNFVEYES